MDTPFLDVLRTYFRGERIEGLFFIVPFGLACLGFAAAILKGERTAFSFGVAAPFVVLGLVLVLVGGAVALRTPTQVDELTTLYQRDQAAFVAQELPRMARVNANWPTQSNGRRSSWGTSSSKAACS